MIRAAAKNYHDVAVVVSPDDYEAIAAELRANGGELKPATHWRLAKKAFRTTADYDAAISARLEQEDAAGELPEDLALRAPKVMDLRYGENPHQPAALEFADPAVAIIKHTNPCGCAEQATLAEAWRKALECDPVSAYGGVVGINRIVDVETAREIAKLFVEAVAAPDYEPEALAVLAAKKNLRLMKIAPGLDRFVVKSITGGFLVQRADRVTMDRAAAVVKTKRAPTEEEWRALAFGWVVAKHVKSNAIVYTRAGQTAGVGAGQMSRVDSVKIGAMKAVLPLVGTVVASDAFFPFADGLEEAVKNGATAFIQPGGSVRDQEVIDAADRLGAAMVFTGVRHFRH